MKHLHFSHTALLCRPCVCVISNAKRRATAIGARHGASFARRVRYDSRSITPLSASLLFPKPTGFYFGQIYRGVRKVQVLF